MKNVVPEEEMAEAIKAVLELMQRWRDAVKSPTALTLAMGTIHDEVMAEMGRRG